MPMSEQRKLPTNNPVRHSFISRRRSEAHIIMSKKERLVAAIESGTVIDHIPAEKTFQVVNLLQLQKLSTPVTIGFNFSSKMVGTKGIIKVSDKFFYR